MLVPSLAISKDHPIQDSEIVDAQHQFGAASFAAARAGSSLTHPDTVGYAPVL